MSYKDDYANNIEAQFYDLENRIIADIIRRIKKTGEITSTADWQITRLHQLGYSSAEIEDIIKDALGASYPEMFELYDRAADQQYTRDKVLYEQINGNFVPYEENQQLLQFVEAAKQQTAGAMANMTSTLGVVEQIGGQMTFLPLTEYYRRTLDKAILDISSGAFDYNSVLRRTVSELAKSGIRTIDYDSGYSSRLPVDVRRSVMTGMAQMTGHVAEQNAAKLGTEYFEVTWHAGARPSHQVWQGKVYTKEELVTVCGLGTKLGLHGINCYHDYYPFFPGLSERNWSDEWLEEQNRIENTPREWRGKEYTAYEARQKQRQMETSMRAQRQKVVDLKNGGADKTDITIAQARYQGQLNEYKTFSKSMDLTPQMERVYIDGLGRVAPGRGVPPIMPRRRTVSASKAKSEVPENVFGAEKTMQAPQIKSGVIKEAQEKFTDVLGESAGIKRHAQRMRLHSEYAEYKKDENLKAPFTYDPNKDIIYYNDKAKNFELYDLNYAQAHELSHRMDVMEYDNASQSAVFKEAVEHGKAYIEEHRDEIQKMFEPGGKYEYDFAMCDMVSALSKGTVVTEVGHPKDYWSDKRVRQEVFANISCIDTLSNSALNEPLLREVYKAYKEIVK